MQEERGQMTLKNPPSISFFFAASLEWAEQVVFLIVKSKYHCDDFLLVTLIYLIFSFCFALRSTVSVFSKPIYHALLKIVTKCVIPCESRAFVPFASGRRLVHLPLPKEA